MLLLINGFIFDIMNIQNNHSLDFEWVPMLTLYLLDHVNDWSFQWLQIVLVKSFKIGWILFSNAKETLPKMLVRKCSYQYCGKQMKDWKLVLIIKSLELPNFFFDIRVSMYWQNAFVKMLLKTGLVGKDL